MNRPIDLLPDRWNRLAPLNGQRLANAWRLLRDFQQSKRSGRAVPMRAMPMSLSVEPTTSCNLRCPECPSGLRSFTRPTGMLQPPMLEALLEELGPWLLYGNLYFQGEPYLHPQMNDLVRTFRRHGIYTSTSTNGHYLKPAQAEAIVESGLNRLIVSIDGATQQTYQQYRVGGQIERVIEGTRNVLAAARGRKGPHLVWQVLAVGPNEQEIPELLRLARSLGVRECVIKTAQLDDPRDGHPLLTQRPELRRYDRGDDGIWRLRNPLADHCWRMWQGCVLTWDGRIVPCCFDKDAHHALGTFAPGEKTFREVWHGAAYAAFRSQIFAQRSAIDMCRNCTEGTQVYAG